MRVLGVTGAVADPDAGQGHLRIHRRKHPVAGPERPAPTHRPWNPLPIYHDNDWIQQNDDYDKAIPCDASAS